METHQFISTNSIKVFTVCHHPLPSAVVMPKKMIILLPGPGGYRIGPHRVLVQLARRLCQEGHIVIRLDYRGRGDSTGQRGTISEDVLDVIRVLDYWHKKYPACQMVLQGLCYGAVIAWIVQQYVKYINKTILWSIYKPATEYSWLEKVRLSIKQINRYAVKALSLQTWKKLISGEINLKHILSIIFPKYQMPLAKAERKSGNRLNDSYQVLDSAKTLMVLGSADLNYRETVKYYRAAAEKLGVSMAVEIIPGADHNFIYPEWSVALIEKTVQWVNRL